jgi:CPA2 family monovalent cation:H+ antiporter-2
VTLFKTAMNIGIMRLMGESWQRASLQGLTLSQLGEFSFLLAATGLSADAIGQAQSRLVIAVTVLSLAISPLWLTTARRVHGLASRQIGSLRELVDAAYGDEVQVVRRGSRRFAIVTQVVTRQAWDKAATRFPRLARIKKPHRATPPPSSDPSPSQTPANTPATSSADTRADVPADAQEQTLTRLGKQVRDAAKDDTSAQPSADKSPADKPKDA